jgi:alkaline phosphatase
MRKVALSLVIFCLSASLGLAAGNGRALGKRFDGPGPVRIGTQAKNIIFMVPDGMSLDQVTAARILKNGPNGAPLALESLDFVGYQRTHSGDSTVTDSAAAASAWAIGEKVVNRALSCQVDENHTMCVGQPPKTILEVAEDLGMSSGLVASSQISHATPAAFGSHTHIRYCGSEIARQYIEETDVDVILGGGVYKTSSGVNCQIYGDSYDWDQQDIIDLGLDYGYAYASTRDEMMAAVQNGEQKILGMFRDYKDGKTPEIFRMNPYLPAEEQYPEYPEGEPTLAEMTQAALDVLEEDRDGFFLMVEGSQVDWAGHGNALHYLLGEMLAFDASVQVVLDWVNANPIRRAQTLVIVVPDHDTGGFAVNGPYGSISEPGDIVEDGWTSGGHTAGDVMIWSQGPQAWNLARPLDNTDLYDVMLEALGF